MNIEIYEDTYNIAVNQYLSRKTAGSKRRKEAFRSKKRRSRVLRDKYGFIADGKMTEYIIGIDADYDPALEKYYADLLAHLDYISDHCDDVDDDWTFFV